MKTHYKTSNYVLVFAFSPLANGYLVIAITSVDILLYIYVKVKNQGKRIFISDLFKKLNFLYSSRRQ